MKVELKQIIDQLSEAICMRNGFKVSAIVDSNNDTIIGWTIVKVFKTGTTKMVDKDLRYANLKELIQTGYKAQSKYRIAENK